MPFSYSHVLWILHHYQELRAGFNPSGQAIDSVMKSKTASHHASFENCCLMAGEVAARIKLCGLDGYLVEERFGMKTNVKHEVKEIAATRHLEAREVARRMRQVICYCEGEARKKEPYLQWKSSHRFERRMR